MNYGKREGRKATGVSNLKGYATVYNGVDYSCIYDGNYYLKHYGDLKKAFGFCDDKLLQHFVNYGMKENRRPSEWFNVFAYANRYLDLQRSFGYTMINYYNHYM